MPSRDLVALALAALVLFLVMALPFRVSTIDDAYITFRYVRNVTEGLGPVYNPGERVEGYTSFSWLVLLSVLQSLGAPPDPTSKLVGIVLGALTMLIVARAVWMRTGAVGAVAAGLLLMASDATLLVNSTDGLETPLVTLLATLAALSFAGEWERPEARPISLVLGAFLYVTRPDALLIPAAGLAAMTVRALCVPAERAARLRWAGEGGAFLVLVVAAHVAWRWSYYGWPLPNTFYVKRGGTPDAFWRGVERLQQFVRSVGLPELVLAVLSVRDRSVRPLLASTVLVGATRVFFVLWSGGEWMGFNRFLAPLVPMTLALAGVGLWWVAGRLVGDARVRRRASAGALLLALLWTHLGRVQFALATAVVYARNLSVAHIAAARDMEASAPAGGAVACEDVGAISYFSRLVVIDMVGLTDEHIAHRPGGYYGKSDPAYVMARRPRFVIVISKTPSDRPFEAVFPTGAALAADVSFQRDYAFRRAYPCNPTYHLWLYERRGS